MKTHVTDERSGSYERLHKRIRLQIPSLDWWCEGIENAWYSPIAYYCQPYARAIVVAIYDYFATIS